MKKWLKWLVIYMVIGIPFIIMAGYGGAEVKTPFAIPASLPKPLKFLVVLLIWPAVLWASAYKPSSDAGGSPVATPITIQ